MSDTNRTKVGWAKETTFGVTPASPAFHNLRIKGSTLGINPKNKESAELNPDRTVRDLIRVANEAGGSLPLEFSWRSHDELLEPVLQSLWVRTPVRDNNGVADSVVTNVTVTTGVYTVAAAASPATDYNSGAFVACQLVRASGFTNPANNGLYRASAASGTSVTLGNTSVAEAAPPAAARLKAVGFRGASGDITATASGLSSTALDFTTLPLAIGVWIKIGGSTVGEQFATAGNNGFARISGAITATAIPLDNLPAGFGVDDGSGKTITVYTGDYIRNGTTEQTGSFEQQYQDLATPEYDLITGAGFDELSFSFKSNDIIESTLTLMASTGTNGTSRASGATDVAAPTNDVLSTAANIGQVRDNGTAYTGSAAVLSLDLSMKNTLRRRGGLGSLASQDLGSGTFRVSGKMSMYYASNAIRTKILAGTSSSWDMRIVDTTAPVGSRCYIIDTPKIKYMSGNPNNPGVDTDRTIDPEFSALGSHATYAYAIQFQRMEEYAP